MHRDERYGSCRSLSPPFAKQNDYRGCGERCQVGITLTADPPTLLIEEFLRSDYTNGSESLPELFTFIGMTSHQVQQVIYRE